MGNSSLSARLLLSGLFLSGGLLAQETILDLEPLTITAQKREQPIQDVPIAVTAYDEGFLDDLNVTDLESLAAFVPGLEIQEQSPNNPGFNIRGITSDSGAANIEPRVSVFQDGVSISKSRGSYVELFDINRVEVLKGPQGTLFGRGAQIGAVHIIQAKPVDANTASLTLGVGNFGERHASGYVNTSLVEDSWFARAAFSYTERDGYIDNVAGGDLNGKNTAAIRLSSAWELGGGGRVDVIFNYQQDDYPGTSFKSGTFAPPGGSTDPNTFAGLNRADDLFIDRTVWGVTGIWTQPLTDAFSLTSITAFRQFDSLEEFDADGTLAYYLEFAEDAQGDQFSQEVRVNYDEGGRLTGFVGASYFYEDGSQRVPLRYDERSLFTVFGAGQPLIGPDGQPLILSNINPLNGQPFDQNYVETFSNFGENWAFEVFADGSFQLSDRWELTAGVRATFEDITSGYLIENNSGPSWTGAPGFLVPASNGYREDTDQFGSAVGRLIAKYSIDETANVFASISRGRRPNVINVDNFVAETLEDEIVWSYELGYKGLYADGQANLSANLFYYDYSNFQTSVTEVDGAGNLVIETRDTGAATAWGVEIEGGISPMRGLYLFGAFSYTNAAFDDFDDDGNPQELAGNTFRLTPDYTGALGINWSTQLREGVVLTIAPNYTFKGQMFFEEANQPGIEQASYGLLNGTISLSFDDGRWEVALTGSNLQDRDFIIDAGNTGAAFGIPTFIAGPPRFYGVNVTARF